MCMLVVCVQVSIGIQWFCQGICSLQPSSSQAGRPDRDVSFSPMTLWDELCPILTPPPATHPLTSVIGVLGDEPCHKARLFHLQSTWHFQTTCVILRRRLLLAQSRRVRKVLPWELTICQDCARPFAQGSLILRSVSEREIFLCHFTDGDVKA